MHNLIYFVLIPTDDEMFSKITFFLPNSYPPIYGTIIASKFGKNERHRQVNRLHVI